MIDPTMGQSLGGPSGPVSEQSTETDADVTIPIESLDTFDLTNVEAHRPLIKEGTECDCKLTNLVLKANNAKTGRNLYVTITTQAPVSSDKGKPIPAGFDVTELISMTPSPKYDPRESLARLQLCFLGAQGKLNIKDLLQRVGRCRFTIERSTQFGDKNRIRFNEKRAPATRLG